MNVCSLFGYNAKKSSFKNILHFYHYFFLPILLVAFFHAYLYYSFCLLLYIMIYAIIILAKPILKHDSPIPCFLNCVMLHSPIHMSLVAFTFSFGYPQVWSKFLYRSYSKQKLVATSWWTKVWILSIQFFNASHLLSNLSQLQYNKSQRQQWLSTLMSMIWLECLLCW